MTGLRLHLDWVHMGAAGCVSDNDHEWHHVDTFKWVKLW